MNRLQKRATHVGLAAAAVLGVLAATASPATAANPVKHCYDTDHCVMDGPGFGGGTMSIDIDAIGGPSETAYFSLNRPGVTACSGQFDTSDPPRSWVCRNLPAGDYYLEVSRLGRARNWVVGLRY